MTDHEKEFVDKLLDVGLARYSAVEPPAGFEHRLLTALRAAPVSEESVAGLVDVGLAHYSPEPRPGLENRILAGLRAAPQPARWLDWRWAGALATAVVAALVFGVLLLREPPAPPKTASTPEPVARPAAPVPSVVQPTIVAKETTRRRLPRVEARAGMPRLETFPAPAPLSEQERLLLRFLQHAPKEQLVARQLGAGPIESLQIQPLFLTPLEIRKPTTEN